jgi:hypothetical protein
MMESSWYGPLQGKAASRNSNPPHISPILEKRDKFSKRFYAVLENIVFLERVLDTLSNRWKA